MSEDWGFGKVRVQVSSLATRRQNFKFIELVDTVKLELATEALIRGAVQSRNGAYLIFPNS